MITGYDCEVVNISIQTSIHHIQFYTSLKWTDVPSAVHIIIDNIPLILFFAINIELELAS